jgi:hypothetical protein
MSVCRSKKRVFPILSLESDPLRAIVGKVPVLHRQTDSTPGGSQGTGSFSRKWVAVNEKGQRIGETHPRAVLTDRDVELLLELREEGFSYRWLGRKFEIHFTHVRRICLGQKRDQLPYRHKRSLGPL